MISQVAAAKFLKLRDSASAANAEARAHQEAISDLRVERSAALTHLARLREVEPDEVAGLVDGRRTLVKTVPGPQKQSVLNKLADLDTRQQRLQAASDAAGALAQARGQLARRVAEHLRALGEAIPEEPVGLVRGFGGGITVTEG